jgi:hypothetical protein
MHGKAHAVAIVGYKWKAPTTTRPVGLRYAWDEIESLVVVDDNDLPYLSIPAVPDGKARYSAQDFDAFIAPLPEKIYYSAEAVDQFAPALFQLGPIDGLPNKDEAIIRYFVTTASAFRKFVRETESQYDPKLFRAIMKMRFAQFIWIVEIATRDQWDTGNVAARAVLDATASVLEVMPVWLLHSQSEALLFARRTVPNDKPGAWHLTPMGRTGFSRMGQNLRPIQTK